MDLSVPSSLEASPVALPSSASRPLPNRRGVFSVATVVSLCGSFDQLLRDIHVGLCSDRGNVIKNDRLSEAWCFRQANIPRHDVAKYLGTEILSRIFGNLPREIEARIVHGEQDAVDSQLFIGAMLNPVHCVQEL